MLSLIEKLINEHGSSEILRERLQLISDRYDHLEEQKNHFQEKSQELEGKLEEEKQKLAALTKQLKQYQDKEGTQELHPETIEVLKQLHQNELISAEAIARNLGLDIPKVRYHLEALNEMDFAAIGVASFNGPAEYQIWAAGRKYLVEVVGI